MSEHDDLGTVVDLMRDPRFCMITSRADGRLVSRPMTPREVTDSGDVWFFVSTESDLVDQVGADPQVNLAFSDSSSWVSVAGTARVVQDRARVDELWNTMVEAWFPGGKDSAEVALLHVQGDTAEYWDSPGGRVATAKAFVTSKLTGERPTGDNGTVDLPADAAGR